MLAYEKGMWLGKLYEFTKLTSSAMISQWGHDEIDPDIYDELWLCMITNDYVRLYMILWIYKLICDVT